MTRFAAVLAFSLIATPALAGTYSARPSASPTQTRIIARDISWSCADGNCRGSTEESRPQVLCQGLAKRAGRLDSFVVNGRAFGAADLQACNAAAKGGGATLSAGN